jgi:hypothetical protein
MLVFIRLLDTGHGKDHRSDSFPGAKAHDYRWSAPQPHKKKDAEGKRESLPCPSPPTFLVGIFQLSTLQQGRP